jgi:hypothetical protein
MNGKLMTNRSGSDGADGAAWAVITVLILLLVLGLLYFGGAFGSGTIDRSMNRPGVVVGGVK